MLTFQTAGRIVCGAGALEKLPELVRELGGGPVLVAGGRRGLEQSGLRERLARLLPGAACHAGLGPEPTTTQVDELRRALAAADARLIVAVGGGSVLDAAKAAAALARSGAPAAAVLAGQAPLPEAGLPVIAAPTTAGSGAEATPNAVLTDPAARRKASIRGAALWPAAALVDPELAYGLPADLTAASGLDALAQAIEAHLSTKANPLTRALSLAAARLVAPALPRACARGADAAARADLALGALLAGMALANARLGLVHGLAHPLGARLGLAHGLLCAVLMPFVLEFNAAAAPGPLAELAAAVGAAPGESLADFVRGLNRRLGLPADLAGRGLEDQDEEFLVAETLASGSTACNPRRPAAAEVRALLGRLAGRGGA